MNQASLTFITLFIPILVFAAAELPDHLSDTTDLSEENKACIDNKLNNTLSKNKKPTYNQIKAAFRYCGIDHNNEFFERVKLQDYHGSSNKVLPEGKTQTRPMDGSNTHVD